GPGTTSLPASLGFAAGLCPGRVLRRRPAAPDPAMAPPPEPRAGGGRPCGTGAVGRAVPCADVCAGRAGALGPLAGGAAWRDLAGAAARGGAAAGVRALACRGFGGVALGAGPASHPRGCGESAGLGCGLAAGFWDRPDWAGVDAGPGRAIRAGGAAGGAPGPPRRGDGRLGAAAPGGSGLYPCGLPPRTGAERDRERRRRVGLAGALVGARDAGHADRPAGWAGLAALWRGRADRVRRGAPSRVPGLEPRRRGGL
ncbi:MAG: FIG00347584: hypothetical protein, partial [uncultured Rubellimicrobium sp.]